MGSGLFTVKVNAGEDAPPPGRGLVTVTAMAPPVNISDAPTRAVTCVPPPFTVPACSVAPKRTVAPLTKLLPSIARVNPPLPALALAGVRLLMVGSGLLTVKFKSGVDAPPPGPGFESLTATVLAFNISAASMVAVTCVAPTLTVPA